MRVNVRYDELKVICNNIQKNSNELTNQLNQLSSVINELGSAWMGYDGVAFISNTSQFINNARKYPILYSTLGSTINVLNEKYRDIDQHYASSFADGLYSSQSFMEAWDSGFTSDMKDTGILASEPRITEAKTPAMTSEKTYFMADASGQEMFMFDDRAISLDSLLKGVERK